MNRLDNLLWSHLASCVDIHVGFFIRLDADGKCDRVESTFGVDPEPFTGLTDNLFDEAISEIRSVSRNAHSHGIKKLKISEKITAHAKESQFVAVVNFVEYEYQDRIYVLLIVPKNNVKDKAHLVSMENAIPFYVDYFSGRDKVEILEKSMADHEEFVKEAGHDLATSVQAIIATLEVISDASIDVSIMRSKAKNVLIEVLNLYSMADGLGLAVDSSYKPRAEYWFCLSTCMDEVKNLLSAEGLHRRISIDVEIDSRVEIHGDRNALANVFQHLIMNGIKYSIHGRKVSIKLFPQRDQIVLRFTNDAQVLLPVEPERSRIYERGYRSDAARLEYATGSGIGLYTARKVMLGHAGLIWCDEDHGTTKFFISFPKARVRGITLKRKGRIEDEGAGL